MSMGFPRRCLSTILVFLLVLSSVSFAQAEEKPSKLTEQDAGGILPVSLFKGRVTNQTGKYILGPGDELSIQVKDLEKFNQEFIIRPDGYATIHPFGESSLSGTDIQGLQTWLEDKFKYYLVKPEVTVDVKEMRPALIYITGAVHRPGVYQFSRDKLNAMVAEKRTQDKAQITVTNILSKAGGVGLKADIENIQIIHTTTGEKEIFNLRELLEGEDVRDLWLLPEDTVLVPEMDHPMDPETFRLVSNSTFFREKFPVVVLGAVGQQGEVQIDPTNNSLNAAVSLAGGFISALSKRDKIIVQRPTNKGGFSRWVIDRDKSNLALMPGDVIYVSDSKVATLQRGMTFLSSITQPYYFSLSGTNVIKNGLFSPQ